MGLCNPDPSAFGDGLIELMELSAKMMIKWKYGLRTHWSRHSLTQQLSAVTWDV